MSDTVTDSIKGTLRPVFSIDNSAARMEQVLLVGPTEPATKRGFSEFNAVNSSAIRRARRAAARLISRQ